MRTAAIRPAATLAPPARAPHPTVECCRIIDVPAHADQRGRLAAIELMGLVPFAVDRMFWVTGLAMGAQRGGHANDLVHELIVCVSGALRVTVDDGDDQRAFILNGSDRALYLPAGMWAVQEAIADATTYVVLANLTYVDALPGYVRDYDEYCASRIRAGA